MTSPATTNLRCPHCGEFLRAFRMPEEVREDRLLQWACFNDDCPYFREGWDWMLENYNVRASYRYRVSDPGHPKGTPLPVWSRDALRDRIVNEGG